MSVCMSDTKDDSPVTRRRVLYGGGTIVSAGLGAVALSTGSASAANLSQAQVRGSAVTTDDGRVDDVTVTAEVSGQYDGLDTAASAVEFSLQVNTGSQWEEIDDVVRQVSNVRSLGPRAGRRTDRVGGSVLSTTSFQASDFRAGEDGGTRDRTLQFRVQMTVYAANGSTVIQTAETDSARIRVTNEEATSATGADGSTDVTGQNAEP